MRLRSEAGFTYLAVLFMVALLAGGTALTGELWHTAARRDKERELLFIGSEFRSAIARYYEATPGPVKCYPKALSELLEDARQRVPQRHLRKIYRDPMTGSADWGLVTHSDGAIMGIYSRSPDVPLKIAGFRAGEDDFENAASYADWKFQHRPKLTPAAMPASRRY